jgi:L-ascorbate metabolism protein UlaG (beta-lactamase superfamily)
MEHEGTELLFDPFFPRHSKAFMPPAEQLAAVESIFITHGHLDHARDVPKILAQGSGNTTVYCTEAPLRALLSKGVDERCIQRIAPGSVLNKGSFTVNVLKGRHIVFDARLLARTLLSPRVLRYQKNLRDLLKAGRGFKEAKETVVYNIKAAKKTILLMGSLNLDSNTEYPKGADLLVMPFQGRSDMSRYALTIIERLQPKAVLLDHYDNTYPPVSSEVNTGAFIASMLTQYPNTLVLHPKPGAEWIDFP